MRFVADWDFDYILKVDDTDVFLDTQKLVHIEVAADYAGIVNDAAMINRTWHHGKVHDPVLDKAVYNKEVNYNYCGGGIGYFLSRRRI